MIGGKGCRLFGASNFEFRIGKEGRGGNGFVGGACTIMRAISVGILRSPSFSGTR